MAWAPLTMRRNIAYEKLGVTRQAIRLAAPITSQLRMAGKKLKKRGLPVSPFYYLKAAREPEARAIAELYYSLPKNQRDLVPIEGYCLAAHLSPTDVLEIITRTCAMLSRQNSAIIAAVSHPDVTESTIDLALNADMDSDKLAAQVVLHKAVGFLPQPGGSKTTVNVNQSANATASAQAATITAPPPEQTIRRLSDRFHAILSANAPAALPEADTSNDLSTVPSQSAIPSYATLEEETDE